IWTAGGALVPLPAPTRVHDRSMYAEQLRELTSTLSCRFVVAHPRYAAAVDRDVLVPWECGTASALAAPVPVSEELPALIACTSGSTALPKGIMNPHARLVLGLQMAPTMFGGPDPSPSLRHLWWAPFFHSMGFMGLLQVLTGLEVHVLPPERFVRDPASWLRLVGETQANVTGGPCSAWAAALRAIERRPEGVDLSSLDVALFALEMVDPDVVERLVTVGARHGFRPGSAASAYGLSEATGTRTALGSGVRIDDVDLDTLVSEGRAVPPRPGRPTKRIASCGVPMSGAASELRIVGPEGPVGERLIGEIQMRGTVMDGYVDDRGEDPFTEEGWLRTGDLGYLADGELYVTGRSKEMVVHQGRNYYPYDIERAIEHRLDVDPGTCVAFAPIAGSEGEVVVALELPAGVGGAAAVDPSDLAARARAAVIDVVGLVPREILVLPTGGLPKAANGKLQRLATRTAHATGQLTLVPER
ncbi:MAG TPA: AMP-binding protein, partial [Gaiellaceae bacterium]|nr:AMP-binding protein [Gaiellaceae bacterium]